MAAFIGAVIGALIFGILIWFIARLNIGLSVDGIGAAIILGALISIVNRAVFEGISEPNILISAAIGVAVTALVIFIAGRLLPYIKTDGIMGALVAAVAIGVVELIIAALLLEAV